MKFKLKKSGVLAIILWVLSFILALNIHPGSPYMRLPDTLLLLGFFPLLIASHRWWLWLLFGIGNIIAGWFLAMADVMPDAHFAQYHALEIKRQIALYHPFIVWLLIGALSIAISIILLLVKLIVWIWRKFK